MTQGKRVRGFVVACDDGVWKVRVKDETSPHQGKKFVVASVHEGITLANGLDVSFLLGSFQQVPKAVDVQPLSPEAQAEPKRERSEGQPQDSPGDHVFSLVVTETAGDIRAALMAPASREEVERHLDEDEHVLFFRAFNESDWPTTEREAAYAFVALLAMTEFIGAVEVFLNGTLFAGIEIGRKQITDSYRRNSS